MSSRPQMHSARPRFGARHALLLAVAAALLLALAAFGYTQASALTTDRLAAHLRAAGATVAAGGDVQQPFFSPTGHFLTIDGEQVQVFEYRLTLLADHEAAQVAPNGQAVGRAIHISWVAPPHFYRGGRLIVLSIGASPGLTRQLTRVLGPPFAGVDCAGTWSAVGGCHTP